MRSSDSKYEWFYLIALMVYLFTVALQFTLLSSVMPDRPIKYLRYLCYLVFLIKILRDEYQWRTVKFLILAGIITVLAFRGSDNNIILFYLIVILAAQNVDSRRIMVAAMIVQAAVLLMCYYASQVGIVTDNISSLTGRVRHGLGFNWTTYAPMFFFFLVAEYVYVRRNRLKLIEYIILAAISFFFYQQTDTRMTFLMSILVLIGAFLLNALERRKCVPRILDSRRVFTILPFLVGSGAILLHAAYSENQSTLVRLNDFLNGRLYWGRSGMDDYGLTLFGTPITWTGMGPSASGGAYNFVDCSYVQIMLEFGIVFLVLILCIYATILRAAVLEKEYILVMVLCLILLLCVTEPRLFTLAFNPFPILLLNSRKRLEIEAENGAQHT